MSEKKYTYDSLHMGRSSIDFFDDGQHFQVCVDDKRHAA